MGYGDDKVFVEVVEAKDGALEYTSADGNKHTYYPARQNWLDLQDLEVWQYLREPSEAGAEPTLVLQLRGEARLEDHDISVIGEPDNKTRNLRVTIEARDMAHAVKQPDEGLESAFFRPVGAAHLGFNRADWEIGNSDEWWVSCYVTDAAIQALCSAVTAGTLRSVRVGVRLRDLYTTEHPLAPASIRSHLFLRPDPTDNSINLPHLAHGYIIQLVMGLSRVDMRPVEVKEDDADQEDMEVRAVAPDPLAVAIGALTTGVAALRTTLKWVGGIAAACLALLALK